MIEQQDWIYAAGFLDGEGCFSISKHRIVLSTSNTYKPTIEWFNYKFGGCIHSYKNPKKLHHRTVHSWYVMCKQAVPVLEGILPFLREKKPQAEILLQFDKLPTFQGTHKGVPVEILNTRAELNNKIKAMKHIEWLE